MCVFVSCIYIRPYTDVVTIRSNQIASAAPAPQSQIEHDADATLTVIHADTILNLVTDKFQSCKNMEEVQKAIREVRDMARKDKN